MQLIQQSEKNPGQIFSSLVALADEGLTGIRIAVAYASLKGCQLLFGELKERVGDRWDALPKEVVVSFDYGVTDPAAIDFLQNVPRCTTILVGADYVAQNTLTPSRSFHDKLYIFDRRTGSQVFVGSANLTERALTVNYEAGTVLSMAAPVLRLNQQWAELKAAGRAYDAALLAQYRQLRGRVPREVVVQQDDPVINPPANVQAGVLWDAIQNQNFVPTAFDNMWVEAGSMSSGGSHNQLELPRGANRFFGYGFATYDDQHHTIGTPVLVKTPTLSWNDRPLTWHGNNKMERINLPTRAQGGFSYPQTAILFRRQASGDFQLEVAPWNSTRANAWRQASAAKNATFSLGTRTTRQFGFF